MSEPMLWAKWDGDEPYPLLGHLLDTAAVASVLGDVIVSGPVSGLLDEVFEQTGVELRIGLAALAASHDVGKADAVFQGQLLGNRSEEFATHLAGLPLPAPGDAWLTSAIALRVGRSPAYRFLRHEAVSGHALVRAGWPIGLAAAVSGHHGRYLPDLDQLPGTIRRHRQFLDSSAWAVEQDSALDAVLSALGLQDDPLTAGLSVPGPVVPLLTGLVCLADWLASDVTFLAHPHLPLLADPGEYLRKRSVEAAAHVADRLGSPLRRTGEFAGLFAGRMPSRPAQAWAVGERHGPGLTVVAVPVGEGKTETALWMHSDGADFRDGLMFALPTTATADAMLDRVLRFYAGTPGFVHLAHGRAILNAWHRQSDAIPVGVCDDDPGEGPRPGSWFTGRHRALTAPVAVGTCDQVLAAAVSHKYAPVRLAALAGKHLVLDEVHTFDPYQDRLLIRLLGWLGYYRTRVTLLTATLPTRRLAAYVDAYRRGWHRYRLATGTGDEVVAMYPAVTRTGPDGALEQIPLAALRRYTHRVATHRLPGGTGYAPATTSLLEQVRTDQPGARIGLIVNTVDRAIDVARRLRAAGHEVLLLHSRMTFAQRARATALLLAALGPGAAAGPVTLVATQIAEASLDIDLDVLVTDLAPMTSLLQRIGRQWRHSMPSTDGWDHPLQLTDRTGDPLLHILVPVDAAGELHPAAHYPYTRAEILRTWRATAALEAGARTQLRIPDDVQAAVDAADISFDDLLADPAEATTVREHLTAAGVATGAGTRVGVDAEAVHRGWADAMDDDDPDAWQHVPVLDELTRGRLWSEEAVTRLRDTDSLLLLLHDATGSTSDVWPGDGTSLLAATRRAQIIEVLDHVIPVSGRLATELRALAAPHRPADWHPAVLLDDTHPMPVAALPVGLALTINGLEDLRTRRAP